MSKYIFAMTVMVFVDMFVQYDLYFYVKRDFFLYSMNVKLLFEFFVMRKKENYLCVKLFSFLGIGDPHYIY